MTQEKSNPVFEETTLAAQLLDEFSSLSQKRKKNKIVTKASSAASDFFDKDYLTIGDFFSPIGFELRVAHVTERVPATVNEFILTLRRRHEMWNQSSPRNQAGSLIQNNFMRRKSKKTIINFFSRIGG